MEENKTTEDIIKDLEGQIKQHQEQIILLTGAIQGINLILDNSKKTEIDHQEIKKSVNKKIKS